MLDVKKWIAKVNSLLPNLVLVHSVRVTWDSFSTDGFAGYISASTIGVADLSKYYWFIGDQPAWEQHNQIQELYNNQLIMRCWSMAAASGGTVSLLRYTKPSAFRLIGIRKVGGGSQ